MHAIIGISYKVEDKKYNLDCTVNYDLAKKAFESNDIKSKDHIYFRIENAIKEHKKNNEILGEISPDSIQFAPHYYE